MVQGSLANVSSAEVATKFIGTALTEKLSKSLMIPSKDIKPSMPLAAYGIDSLIAIIFGAGL